LKNGVHANAAMQVNGKDSGSHYEIIFEVDARPRTSTPLLQMAGFFNALAVAQTEEGLRGSLVPWPSDRCVGGYIQAVIAGGLCSADGWLLQCWQLLKLHCCEHLTPSHAAAAAVAASSAYCCCCCSYSSTD
jgi:hypothetical protein